MKITFLGTNGWYDTSTGNTICTLIDHSNGYIVLDAGNGLYKADQYIKKNKPIDLFLSHFHLDHIEGLHILAKFNFPELNIYGPAGTKDIIPAFIGKNFSVPIDKLPYKCNLYDLSEGWHDKPVRFRCLDLLHVTTCYGYRFEIEKRSISYCTDTGYCREAVELSRGADILISECALRQGSSNPEWPHMNPELAAKLASESNAKKLVLTHFDANEYRSLKQRSSAERTAKKTFNRSLAAKDGVSIKV